MDHVRAQCPHTDCQMFMLFPKQAAGSVVKCLVCKSPMQIDAKLSPDGTRVETTPIAQAPKLEKRRCPYCHAKMKVPTADPKQPIQCPKCNNIFAVASMQMG